MISLRNVLISFHIYFQVGNSLHIYWQVGNSLHSYWQVGNSLHIYWQVGNSAYVGCFIFWAPNTIVDSITYGGMILTVRIPEPSYFSERWMQRPARHKMPATRVLDHPPSPTVPTPLAPSDKSFLGKPLAPWTTPRIPLNRMRLAVDSASYPQLDSIT